MATYTKLKSGDWGIKLAGKATPGQRINVTKKSGETKAETVGSVVWTDGQTSICTIQRQAHNGGRGGSDGSEYRGGRRERGIRGCGDCARLGRMCAQCRYDDE